MEDIIAPVPKELLKAELTEDKRLRFTHRSDNEIYIVTAFDSPNVMREIGRLREIAFRAAGGGTGKSLDIDEFDTMDVPYKQLVVWNPECNDIIGGYRYLWGKEVQFDENGEPRMATAHGMFRFSEKFLKPPMIISSPHRYRKLRRTNISLSACAPTVPSEAE